VKAAHMWRELKFPNGGMRARLSNGQLGRMCISFGTAVCLPSSSLAHRRVNVHHGQVRRAELVGLRLVSDRGVEMLLQWCPHLNKLRVQDCPNVTIKARHSLGSILPMV
jgi:hypothetical protein